MTRSLEYTLPPLSRPESQIRLLYLHAGNEDEEIGAEITAHDLDKAPEYNAISYTWGSADDGIAMVYIDGEPFLVWKNCHYALWQARIHHPNEYIWIDAICINQADDIEKSAQVANMGRIFADATLMMASIGPHADDSELLVHYGFDDFDTWERMSNEKHMDWIRAKGEELVPRVSEACAALCERSYWKRLWVVQEVAVSARKVVLCGDSCMAWNTVDLRDRQLKIEDLEMAPGEDLQGYGKPFSATLIQPPSTAVARRTSEDLLDIVGHFADHQCSDPRDHVYGLLPLVKWPDGMKLLYPDYTLSTLQLAVQVFERVPVVFAKIVVGILRLSSDDPDVHRAIQRRGETGIPTDGHEVMAPFAVHAELQGVKLVQLSTRGPSDLQCPAFNRKTHAGCNGCKVRNARQDLQAEQLVLKDLEDSMQWSSPRPWLLYNDRRPIGLLCHDALPGDFLAHHEVEALCDSRPHRRNMLVLRYVGLNYFFIVGQALLIIPSDPYLTFNGASDSHLEAGMCTDLSAEDWVVLAAQDYTGCMETHREGSVERLVTGISDQHVAHVRFARFENIERVRGLEPDLLVEHIGDDFEL